MHSMRAILYTESMLSENITSDMEIFRKENVNIQRSWTQM